jgi:preprotein translocase subunit YajC
LAVRRNVQTVNPLILIFLIAIVGMLFMTRSAKNKQRAVMEMRDKMEPGTGIRTIGGMYAVVKEVNQETVLLELTDGVHAHFTKGAISAVLSEDEFNRIVHGIEPEDTEGEADEDGDAGPHGTEATADGADTPDAPAAQDDDAEEPTDDRVELHKGGDGPASGSDSTK